MNVTGKESEIILGLYNKKYHYFSYNETIFISIVLEGKNFKVSQNVFL